MFLSYIKQLEHNAEKLKFRIVTSRHCWSSTAPVWWSLWLLKTTILIFQILKSLLLDGVFTECVEKRSGTKLCLLCFLFLQNYVLCPSQRYKQGLWAVYNIWTLHVLDGTFIDLTSDGPCLVFWLDLFKL